MKAIFLSAVVLSVLFAADAYAAQTSTANDRTGLEVTVYNSNLGMVKDRRLMKIPGGRPEFVFRDVSSNIIPESVILKSVKSASGPTILEQSFDSELLNPSKLMDRYVGKEVKLVYFDEADGKEKTVTATLISNNNGPIYKIGNDISIGFPGRVVLPSVPDGFVSSPTLKWVLNNNSMTEAEMEVSYLTSNLNWQADYVLLIDKNDATGKLSGRATVTNRSGMDYANAKLKLVAGNINRSRTPVVAFDPLGAVQMKAEGESFAKEVFFEYHTYTVDFPVTLKNNQQKQISLLSASNIALKKEYIIKTPWYYSEILGPCPNVKVAIFISFINNPANSLGMPLPGGVVRLYKADSEGGLQFMGEDRIEHTPKDETVKLRAGLAFDIKAEKKQTVWKRVDNDSYETEYEVTIRNHKNEDIVVNVIEIIPKQWTMLAENFPHEKNSASEVQWKVPVKKNSQATLTYRVRVKF